MDRNPAGLMGYIANVYSLQAFHLDESISEPMVQYCFYSLQNLPPIESVVKGDFDKRFLVWSFTKVELPKKWSMVSSEDLLQTQRFVRVILIRLRKSFAIGLPWSKCQIKNFTLHGRGRAYTFPKACEDPLGYSADYYAHLLYYTCPLGSAASVEHPSLREGLKWSAGAYHPHRDA